MYKVSKICIEVVAVFACMFFAVSPAYAEGMAMSIDVVETEIAEQPSTADKTEAQAEEVEDKTKSDQVEVEKPSAEPEKKAETVTEPEPKTEEAKTTETQAQEKVEVNASTAASTNNIAMQCTTPKNGWVTEMARFITITKAKFKQAGL